MASIVAYIEVRQAALTAPARFALAEARRVADTLGATVYALLAIGPATPEELEELAGRVGKAGADRILCCADEALAGPSLAATHGTLLATVAEHLRPFVVLFPAGETGSELGRPLAVHMGAAFMPCASLEILPANDLQPGQLQIRCWRAACDGQRVVNLHDFDRPVVASLSAGMAPPVLGEPALEMEELIYPEPSRPLPRILSAEPDPGTDVVLAEKLILLEEGVSDTTRVALESALTPEVQVLVPEDPRRKALARACPTALLVVASSASKANFRPGIAPHTLVALIAPRGVEREFSLVKECARPEKDAPLGGLVAALSRASSTVGKNPK
jgi:electron transfer flavoprotein alpha subunit